MSRDREREGIQWGWRPVTTATSVDDSVLAALLRSVPSGSLVLEIGVGPGFALCRLGRAAGCKCVGIDVLSSAMLAARGTSEQLRAVLHLAQASGFQLPFRDSVFDVVISLGVIEHFPVDRARALLREHARVCRPGGRVLVSTPNALDFVHSLVRWWRGTAYPYHPERSYTPWGLAKELELVGLTPLLADGYAPFWSLREDRLTYAPAALLHKLGLLEKGMSLRSPFVCRWLGNMTLQTAVKP